ncbi:MAG: hypothetical protein LIO46_03670 [Clostridiales bacterium]|nr:hypothetical protein [Clostridiales bacterium]
MANEPVNIQRLQNKAALAEGALKDANFECQRLEILNAGLEFQLKEVTAELSHNIELLQKTQDENQQLHKELEQLREKVSRFSENYGEVIQNAQKYARKLIADTDVMLQKQDDTGYDFADQMNTLLTELTEQLDSAQRE